MTEFCQEYSLVLRKINLKIWQLLYTGFVLSNMQFIEFNIINNNNDDNKYYYL